MRSKSSSQNGPSPMRLYVDYAQLLKTLCLVTASAGLARFLRGWHPLGSFCIHHEDRPIRGPWIQGEGSGAGTDSSAAAFFSSHSRNAASKRIPRCSTTSREICACMHSDLH